MLCANRHAVKVVSRCYAFRVSNAPLRCLLIDDEPPARRRLRSLLEGVGDFVVAGEAGDAATARAAIAELLPDVVFSDIEMPGGDGFSALDAGRDPVTRGPIVVFVTAYEQHAVRAFDASAVDYLLKPFDGSRFDRALGRIRERAAAEAHAGSLVDAGDRLLLRVDAAERVVHARQIDFIAAAGNYLRVFVRDLDADDLSAADELLVRATLATVEGALPPARFARIHRSTLVNLDRVCALRSRAGGDLLAVLRDGTELVVSRRFRDRLRQRLGELR